MNPAMKDISVRQWNTAEAQMFDKISKLAGKIQMNPAVGPLSDSIIELRDLQRFLREVQCNSEDVKASLSLVGEGLSYYLGRMHETDAKVLAKKSPATLFEDMSVEEFYRGKEILADCIEGMCKVNAAVINCSLKGGPAILQSKQ